MIAIVNPQFYGVHGIARYIDSFLTNLPEGYPTVYLITGDENREERSYAGVEIIHLPYSSGRLSLFTWGWRARKLITRMYAEGKIRWVNLHFPPLIPGLLLPTHVPVVLTAHTTYFGMFDARSNYPDRAGPPGGIGLRVPGAGNGYSEWRRCVVFYA